MTDDETPRETFSHDPIGHAEARAGMTVGELADEYGSAGIGASAMHEAVGVYSEMLDDDVTVFLGLAGAMVPTGMRRIVADLVRDGHVDALVTTGANLTHDAIEAIGGKHHHGEVHVEGKTEREHDERLRDEGVDRIYNVYLPQEHFALFESHLREEVFPPLETACEEQNSGVSIRRFTAELGRANAEVNEREGVEGGPGIAAAAYEHDVPVYCPAVQDSVLGLQAWMYSQTSAFALDALSDMTDITDQAFEMLVAPDAYDYAVQLTMDTPETGGLSGATLDEARSWGKLEKAARNASVYADATITFPLLVAAARERAGE
ncbi:deoxyhypusine synthase [Halobacteriales archaeon QH_6_68_27]|nr:MAG: deoxyhypusine synthase [Halobacteriales archaeon QH_6_68_27]